MPNTTSTGSNMSNPHYAKAVNELRDFREDSPIYEDVLKVYLTQRARRMLRGASKRDFDPVEAEQAAWEWAGDMDRNGTGKEIYMPRLEKYLEYKSVSRNVLDRVEFTE